MADRIEDELYCVSWEDGVVCMTGTLRLNGAVEYEPVVALLSRALDAGDDLVLDLSQLDFLNSSGIAVLSRFVIDCRNRGNVRLTLRGSARVAWQGKSLANLQRLMPALTLEMV